MHMASKVPVEWGKPKRRIRFDRRDYKGYWLDGEFYPGYPDNPELSDRERLLNTGLTLDREANVLLELRIPHPMSEEVLAANAERVLDALLADPSNCALGPALSVNPLDGVIKLCFDVQAASDADVRRQVRRVVTAAGHETSLDLRVRQIRIEGWSDAPHAKLAAAR